MKGEEPSLPEELKHNGYLEKFIDKHNLDRPRIGPICGVPKKPIHPKLVYKGDHLVDEVSHRFRSRLNRTFLAV